MNFIDVRLFEFIPDAQAFIHLSMTHDLPIGDPRITDIGKRGREASILQGNSIGRTRIYGNIEKFEYQKIVLEVRENIGTDKPLNYEPLFLWLEREFPSLVASSVDKTMRSIELVVNEMTNNGSVEMVKEATSYARDFGIGITVSCAGPDSEEHATRNEASSCLRSAIERNPLGVILLLSNISSAEESLLQTRNIPYVIVDPVGQVSADALGVDIDNWTGGMLATQYLISLGHRRIAVITGPTNSQSSQARLSGYMAALQKNGISADPHLIKVGDYVSDKAYKAACDLLEMREQDRPTAIFAFNDLGAINVYRAARQHGISLPEQLSIIGFDDVYPAASMCPSLTTIRQPFNLIARQCIDLILEAREGKVEQNYFILPTQLVERESCTSPALP